MKLLRRCLRELRTPFDNDSATAAWRVVWIILACSVLPQVPAGIWSGPILFAGLSVIFPLAVRQRP